MKLDITLECPVAKSFRVDACVGMFDLDVKAKATRSWSVELPSIDEDWKIGAIVGPSGSGKSVVARHAFAKQLIERFDWPKGKSIVDAFPKKASNKHITGILNSVGFSSPPDWVKPYNCLSNGQQFRCDLARALLTPVSASADSQYPGVIAFDEFTSVVDRQVAQFGSAAVAKTIRKERNKEANGPARFVAVTCHYDILDWLNPDWVLDMATGKLERGCLRPRPKIKLEIFRVHHSAWKLFKQHHYLTGNLNTSCRCYVAFWNKRPVCFCAAMCCYGQKNTWRLSRTVVLPDFQGMGIGCKVADCIARILSNEGKVVSSSLSHPALIAHRKNSKNWKCIQVFPYGRRATGIAKEGAGGTLGRPSATFRYIK